MESQGVAFITGAGIGIGRAIALRLADDGYDIAVNGRPSSKEKIDSLAYEIRQKGRKALSLIGDVSIEADVQKMVEDVVQHLGGLDVVCRIYCS
jgi:NAD(P)-dependent dehydrogenase (short-subunit alcohol dehydrogenase family)